VGDEDEDLRDLLTTLDRVDGYLGLTSEPSGAWTVQPGSALAADDRRSAPGRSSRMVPSPEDRRTKS
jgi:hypothetical protein